MGAESAVQSALNSALTGIGLTVYDVAPQGADAGTVPMPCVTIGTIILTPFDDYSSTGFTVAARIHTRSRSGGMKEMKDVQSQIYTRLHRGSLTITGYSLIDFTRTMSEPMQATDGSFHGVCEYRGLITTA